MTSTVKESEEYVAFCKGLRIASGPLSEVALGAAAQVQKGMSAEEVLIFDARNSKPVDLDLRGSNEEIAQRYQSLPEPELSRGRGRPKLGVIGKEVTLLPRHWEWLANQPGGASVVLRKLVDQARKELSPEDAVRAAQSATYNFMYAIGGDLQGYEEAMRALYSADKERFAEEIAAWPKDIRQHAMDLAGPAFV